MCHLPPLLKDGIIFFAFSEVWGQRECSVPTFSCPSPSLTLFPFFQAKFFIINQPQNTEAVLAVSGAAFVERNHFLPQETKIYNDPHAPAPSCPPPPDTKMSGLQVISCVRSTSPSSTVNLQRARVCVCTCFFFFQMCVSAAACVSHRRASTEVQRAVSLLPHTGQRVQLQRDVRLRSHLTSAEWFLYKLSSSVLPSGGLTTVVGLQLLLHLGRPQFTPRRHPCVRIHTHTHTHTRAVDTHEQSSLTPH